MADFIGPFDKRVSDALAAIDRHHIPKARASGDLKEVESWELARAGWVAQGAGDFVEAVRLHGLATEYRPVRPPPEPVEDASMPSRPWRYKEECPCGDCYVERRERNREQGRRGKR